VVYSTERQSSLASGRAHHREAGITVCRDQTGPLQGAAPAPPSGRRTGSSRPTLRRRSGAARPTS